MGLPRAFVGFSSTDIHYYRLMQAWKESEHIDFEFVDCQLPDVVNSDDEAYVKRRVRERIRMAGTFIQLIGADTRLKTKFVRWEAEVAIEQDCRLICVNLDGSRKMVDATTPAILKSAHALFVPFQARIIAHALTDFQKSTSHPWYYYPDSVYTGLGL